MDAPDELNTLQSTITQYQGLSNTITNPKHQSKTNLQDALGQLTESVDPMLQITTFVRDAFGNLTQTIDPKTNTVSITYDKLGRKIALQDPDLGLINYCIDPRGLQWQQVSPRERANIGSVPNGNYCTQLWSTSTTFQHDLLDRLIARLEPDLASYWVYDSQSGPTTCGAANGNGCGKLIEAYTWLGGVTINGGYPASSSGSNALKDYDRTETYDSAGRPSQSTVVTHSATQTTTTTYDPWGRPMGTAHVLQQPGAATLNKTYCERYNAYGYLRQIARTAGDCISTPPASNSVLWQANKQDAADRVIDAALGNGLAISREYNPYTARLDDGLWTNTRNNNALTLHENYQYDILGNVSNRVEEWGDSPTAPSNFSEQFTYDDINRLSTSQAFNQPLQTFIYDPIGNIVTKTGVGVDPIHTSNPGTYTYGSNAGPHAVTAIAGLANGSFTYDANGNQTGGAGRTTGWTSFDMPLNIKQVSSGNNSSFTYGPEHQRTVQTRTDMTLVYTGAMEIDTPTGGSAANATVKTYWPMGIGLETDAAGTTSQRWTHEDRLGSVVAITDENGVLVEKMAYDAWGSRRSLAGAPITVSVINYAEIVDNKGFTDQEELDQLGLVHLNGRVYDPFVARFISADPEIQDPTHSQSYNRYTYVWNNPTNLIDPSGFAAASNSADGGISFDEQRVEMQGAGNPNTACRGNGCKAFMDALARQRNVLLSTMARQYCRGSGDGLCVAKTTQALTSAASNSNQATVEVLTEEPVGNGASSLGHAAIVIDGIVYTFTHDGMMIMSKEKYISANHFRDTIGLTLNVPDVQALSMIIFLGDYNKEYSVRNLSTCVQPVYLALIMGGVLNSDKVPLFPATLGAAVLDSGKVKETNIYEGPDRPKPNTESMRGWKN